MEVDFGEAGYLPKHENNGDMQKLTVALYEYVNREEIPPDHTGRMGEDEEEVTVTGLEPGFYLVTGSSLTMGDTVHMPNPFLVELGRGESRFCDIKSDHFPVNPTDPTDPTGPTDPTNPGGNSSGGGGSPSGGGGGSPATTAIGEGETPLVSFTNPPDELLALEEPLVPLASLPMIPKLGDMGAAGYLYGMIASLCLFAVSLISRQALGPGEER